MKTYQLPRPVLGLIFDMDMTLYHHLDYYDSQLNNQVLLLARKWGRSVQDVQNELEAWQDRFERDNGKKPSFGNSLLGAFGVPISESVELRRQAIRPEDYLVRDERLIRTLESLSSRYQLVLVTNNPSDVAVRTLRVLGVEEFFPRVVGLDESEHSKPNPRAFELAFSYLGLDPRVCVSIGDRYPVDLEVPIRWGSGGILVESMDDVYSIPTVLDGKVVVTPRPSQT